MTKTRLRNEQQQKMRHGFLSNQQMATTLDPSPYDSLGHMDSLDIDGHEPAVKSPKMMTISGPNHFNSAQNLPKRDGA